MRKLWYLPLEQYPERYTQLMSCKDGWAESKFKECNVNFQRVDGSQLSKTIKVGNVLDAVGRPYYAMTQIQALLGQHWDQITDDDVVYVEDFWHPGIESLFYARQLCKRHFKIGCFCHAQSVDDSDFTWPMRDWMRPIEQGFGKQYDFIFVCSPILKRLLVEAGVGSDHNIYVVGLPFNKDCLKRQLVDEFHLDTDQPKQNYCLFSSRFDDEKDPMFFLDLVEACPDLQFKLVSPYKTRPPSTNKTVQQRLERIIARPGSNLELVDTSDKKKYYETLAKAKVQFNCAIQDWVSWTLVEAAFMKCLPLYPKWKDFPSELHNDENFLYERKNLQDAKQKLERLMASTNIETPEYVVLKHDQSWNKYLETMGA